MTATATAAKVDLASLKKFLTAAGKSLPDSLDEVTFNSVRDHLLDFMKTSNAEAKKKAKAAEKKASKPKRGPTGYILFSNASRDDVRKRMPDATVPEVSKELGKMWGQLTDAQKAEWNTDAKTQSPPSVEKTVPEKVKRGPTAFFVFMGEKRGEVKAAHPDASVKVIASELGAMWRALTDDQKKAYQEKAKVAQ